jgi:aminoglycoside phosphotransferase family enzyme/predicted kinase
MIDILPLGIRPAVGEVYGCGKGGPFDETMGGADSFQIKVLNFMGRPEAYSPSPTTVERIETHASIVWLAGDFAYKVKRAVKYPFLDFSTLEKRHAACLDELRVNRRTAPALYLDVIPVALGENGSLRLGGNGKPVEWVLRMRRFDQAKLYDRMAEEGRLNLAAMPRLAEVIAAFHAAADRVLSPDGAVPALEAVLADNETGLAADQGVVPRAEAEALAAQSHARLAAIAPLLEARAQGGYLRHCHGDLHLRNIVEIDAAPVLFDAIEFDDKIATIDVLYDLAFLLMDLGKRGLRNHANAVLNAYLDAGRDTGNLVGLGALPLFLAMRAAVRAKVELLRARVTQPARGDAAQAEAKAYVALAAKFFAPAPPRLVAIGGLSGSGKSAVASAIARFIGAFPGAVHVRSDVERKRLFGVAPHQRLPAHAYAPEVSDQVYAICRKRALMALEGGQAAILDAVHAKESERAAAAQLASDAGVPFAGLWLEASPDILRKRVAERKGDVSDATPEVVDTQLGYSIGRQSFQTVDAGHPLDRVVAECLRLLEADSREPF